MNPLLKWAGGKRRIVETLRETYERHQHRRFVELFAGGAALSFAFEPRHALLNDINQPLMNFYKHVQRGHLNIEDMPKNTSEAFYAARERFNALQSAHEPFGTQTREAAELFYYLNKSCFNGLCRFNKSGEFNVPYGKRKKISFDGFEIGMACVVMQQWLLSSVDFKDALLLTHADDFIFADPPYDGGFTDYSRDGFTWTDQLALAGRLAKHTGPVITTNAATDRIVELYNDWRFDVKIVDAHRSISADGDRASAREMIATRNV